MAKKRRQKFSDLWSNLTNLGKQYGFSAIKMGKTLKDLGLRDEKGSPTEKALSEGLAKSTPLKDGTPFYMWHKGKVSALMGATGQEKLTKNEVLAQDLAKEWMRVSKLYQETVTGMEEEMLWLEAEDIRQQAGQKGLRERVNEILTERKFKGERLE
jgi:hypothetical protein